MSQVLRKLPKIRSKWPQEAVLAKTTQFNLLDGGKVVGVMTINAGTKVKIIEVKSEHAVVRVAGNVSPLPVDNLDLVDRMGGAEKILAYPDDETPKPSQPPAQKESTKQ